MLFIGIINHPLSPCSVSEKPSRSLCGVPWILRLRFLDFQDRLSVWGDFSTLWAQNMINSVWRLEHKLALIVHLEGSLLLLPDQHDLPELLLLGKSWIHLL